MQDDTSTFFYLTEIRITSRYREMIQNEYNKNFLDRKTNPIPLCHPTSGDSCQLQF